MANASTSMSCDAPFLPEDNFPWIGGEIRGRFCANITTNGNTTTPCCLPCPITDWIYSNSFPQRARTANYVSILSLVLNLLLLLTFIVVPQEKSHRHYLSTGLNVSLILIALAFVIPLGTKPDFCHDQITPNNLHTDVGCGFTGAFTEAGAMGVVVWIFLRSVWTTLRIMTNFKHTEILKRVSIAVGIGVPALFLAISLPITGVTYGLGNVCVPNNPSALPTWFAWILIFSSISWIVQVATIFFILYRFARGARPGTCTHASQGSSIPGSARQRREAWRRLSQILKLQWRSIVLAFVIVNLTIFYGLIFIDHYGATTAPVGTTNLTAGDFKWIACLIANGGDKAPCLSLINSHNGIGLQEERAIGTLILSSTIGLMVFLLMLRWSMFVGWWELLRHPKSLFRRPSITSEEFEMIGTKKMAFEQGAQGEKPQLRSVSVAGDRPSSRTVLTRGADDNGDGTVDEGRRRMGGPDEMEIMV